MKVSELIALLHTYPPDAVVSIETEENSFEAVLDANEPGKHVRELTIYGVVPNRKPVVPMGMDVEFDGKPINVRSLTNVPVCMEFGYLIIDAEEDLPTTGTHTIRAAFQDQVIERTVEARVEVNGELRFWPV